jgi:uncharacterized circularly permuted ATP-grasp superfamily protein/uncharacterized alpha-E superfamily protein
VTVLRDYAAALTQPTLTGVPSGFDEVVGFDGSLRGSWKGLAGLAVQLTPDDLSRADRNIRRFLADDGVTYARPGQVPGPWRLDPLPWVLSAEEWAPLEVGLAQRAELLNAIVVDLYGEQRLLREKLIPASLIFGHGGFVRPLVRRAAHDRRPLTVVGADLGRASDGSWLVLADRTQAPSGIGYAMENRRVISQVLPELYREAGLHRIRPFMSAIRSALMQSAEETSSDPRVVVLSPGTHSETAYDQANLAAALGFPLVQGNDLTVRDGNVYLRGYTSDEQVHVILRRVDANWSDPLELRADSQLGVAGLSEAVRRGNVRVVNGLGSGVLENPGLLPFLPAISEALLGESLRLPSVESWWCGDPESREHVLAHLDRMLVRPIDRQAVTASTPETLRAEILAAPHRFVGQSMPTLSQGPVLDDGRLAPRRFTLRTFTLRYGSAYRPMVGGLATSLVDSAANASVQPTKDVWVLKSSRDEPDQGLAGLLPVVGSQALPAVVPRALDDLYWFGRYSSRAEDTLRIVLVAHALAEDFVSRPYSIGGRAMGALLEVVAWLGGPPAVAGDVDRDLRSMLLDVQRLGSVAQSIDALREAAQDVRDQLSPDVWRAFSAFDRAAWDLARYEHGHQITESAGRMLNAVLALYGVTANMMRDDGWRMIRIGGWLERAHQVTRLLGVVSTRKGMDVDRTVLGNVLLAAESSVTHQRRYRGNVRARTVLELMLVDLENPRSLIFALTELADNLRALPASTGSTRPERLVDELLESVRAADLATLTALGGEHRPHLVRFLAQVESALQRIGDAITDIHLSVGPPMRPLFFSAMDAAE